MSSYENPHDDDPRFEPWLGVMGSSIIPVVLALSLPIRYFVPLIAATVTLFVAGLLMLRRQTIRRRRAQPASLDGAGVLAPTTQLESEAP